jgi:Fe2+ transport system protein FeoA
MTLDDLPPNTPGSVVRVTNSGSLGDRLMEMGLTPGTEIRVIRRGWLGQPMQIQVRSYRLSLRRSDARNVEVSG